MVVDGRESRVESGLNLYIGWFGGDEDGDGDGDGDGLAEVSHRSVEVERTKQ